MDRTVLDRDEVGGAPERIATDPSEHACADLPLEVELRRAIERGEFRVFYQPIVALDTQRITGFEALLRWEHPHRGLLAPSAFMDVAERTGLIVPMSQWTLREACACLSRWRERCPQAWPLVVSVNLSAKQLEDPALVEQVRDALDAAGLDAECLELEITETLVMRDPGLARELLQQLRAFGVRLLIDDFGTGYSSLSYLRDFPVHTLKVDRSFVGSLDERKENVEIVRAILAMARNLGLDVIAEGIETERQLALLKLLKCDYGQGYLIARPLDEQRAEELVRGSASRRRTRTPAVALPAPQDDARPVAPPPKARAVSRGLVLGCALLATWIIAALAFSARTGRTDAAPVAAVEPTAAREDPVAAWLANARASLGAHRYVLPADDNALAYCDRVLSARPGDAEARTLRQQAVDAALADADTKARSGKLDRARAIYVALKPFAEPPLIERGLRRLEFESVAVAHDHFLGSCAGTLRFNGYTISFSPSEGGRHGFTERLDRATARMDGKFLKVVLGDRTFRFKSAGADLGTICREINVARSPMKK